MLRFRIIVDQDCLFMAEIPTVLDFDRIQIRTCSIGTVDKDTLIGSRCNKHTTYSYDTFDRHRLPCRCMSYEVIVPESTTENCASFEHSNFAAPYYTF